MILIIGENLDYFRRWLNEKLRQRRKYLNTKKYCYVRAGEAIRGLAFDDYIIIGSIDKYDIDILWHLSTRFYSPLVRERFYKEVGLCLSDD